MPIELPELPYPKNALEPYMSKQTLEFHYGKHHKKYIETLNKLITGTEFENKTLEEIMQTSFHQEEKIYNNAAQAWNHTFFWNCLTPEQEGPSPEFSKVIAENFGSFEDFKTKFTKEAKNLFGSGWAWMVKDSSGAIKIRALGNAGNPLVECGETPLLTCDVWEHAYYLDYQNDRPQFLENFWQIVNWNFVEENLSKDFSKSYGTIKPLGGQQVAATLARHQ